MHKQDEVFAKREADAWFVRNQDKLRQAGPATAEKDTILQLLNSINIPKQGQLLDIGGGNGRVSAGFIQHHTDWQATVIEPSGEAIRSGRKAFPKVQFIQGSVTKRETLPSKLYDVVLIRGVLCWIDRLLLGQAIANVDSLVRNGGYLIVSDFYTPAPRANAYHHCKDIFTYKQDYTAPFLALNLYCDVVRYSGPMTGHTHADPEDPYDVWWTDAILQKDVRGRYRR